VSGSPACFARREPAARGTPAKRCRAARAQLFGVALVASLTGWFAAAMFASVVLLDLLPDPRIAMTFSDITVRDARV
jgi:hypothetical protein